MEMKSIKKNYIYNIDKTNVKCFSMARENSPTILSLHLIELNTVPNMVL